MTLENSPVTEEEHDAQLLELAIGRMSHYDPTKNISEAELLNRLGISADDIAGFESIELE